MKTAIIIHGYYDQSEVEDTNRPASSNDHWIPWLQRQLLLTGIETQNPEMPRFYKPNYKRWKDLLEQFNVNENTILVGHSCGGGFLIRWLSENQKQVDKVILVAPWLDPEHIIDPEFFNFQIDSNISSRTAGLTILYSSDDYPDVIKSVEILKSKLKNAKFIEFQNKGHFVLNSLKTEKFPELLEIILNP